ncbi:MAG: hypothetical protein HOV80_28220 [Polyangiaceae bacterium]|nr:hypothetical protein [Polyangiaceae bacterium]
MDRRSKAQVLVTTRHKHRLPRESMLELGPLELPESVRALATSAAGSLFLARAREARAAVDVRANERLLKVLVALDGIPLAIELAAAKDEIVGVSGLESRLDARLELLTRPSAKRRSMREAIAWSWDLLDPRERAVLAGCAIFRGGFTFDAAEQVVQAPKDVELLSTIGALVEKSLITVRQEDEALPPRLSLFETVREFALAELTRSGGLDDARARHDAYALERGTALSTQIERTGSPSARRELAQEIDKLLDVHQRALAAGAEERERALDALLAADPLLSVRSPPEEIAALWKDTAALFEGKRQSPARRAQLYAGLGFAIAGAHRDKDGTALLERALVAARRAEDPSLEGRIHLDLGLVAHRRRDLARAKKAYLLALPLLEGHGRISLESRAHVNLGALWHDERDFVQARPHYERAIAMAASIGDRRTEGITLTNLGVMTAEEGDDYRAESQLRLALELLRDATDARLEAITWGSLGVLSLERGDLARARKELQTAEDGLAKTGDLHSLGIARARLAVLAALEANEAEAQRLLSAARSAFLIAHDDIGVGLVELAFVLCDTTNGRLTPEQGTKRLRLALAREVHGRSLHDASDDARGLARIAERALSRLEAGAAPEIDPPSGALVVGPHAETFRTPDGVSKYIGDHDAAHRIFCRLVDERTKDPRSCLPLDVLIEAGWPGQSLQPLAAANRAYVALAFLRKNGLSAAIARVPGGYLIDPALPVVRVSRPLAPRPPARKR